MANIVKNYFKVLEVISALNCELMYKLGVEIREKTSDLKAVTLSLTTEFMPIDSENSLFNQLFSVEIPI